MTTELPTVAAGTDAGSDAASAASDGPDGAPDRSEPPHTGNQASPTGDQHGGAPHGFFAWVRGLGLQRQPGWIGGVAVGIAARIGIDPIIVRGILVVLALFAPPVLVFYGVAWLLLPDTDGRIQLQRLLRGDPQPALAGIAILVFTGMLLPLSASAQLLTGFNVFSLGSSLFWGWPGLSITGLLFNLVLLGGLVAFVLWLVRRSSKNSRSGGAATAPHMASHMTPAGTAAPGTDGGGIGSGDPDAAATNTAGATVTAAVSATAGTADAASEPVSPGPAASVDEMAAWKLQHEAWRTERERFNAAQADANRAARAQWAAENKARSQEFAAQAAEYRRARKRQRPRVSAAAVFFTLGLALVAGAGSGIAALASSDTAAYAGTIGVLVAALVASVAMVVAGALRRRSGFLAVVAVLLLLVGVGTALLPRQAQLLWPSSYVNNAQQLGAMTQPWGDLTVWVYNRSNDPSAMARTMTLEKANGDLHIYVDKGGSLVLRADLAPGQSIMLVQESLDTGNAIAVPAPRRNAGGDYSLQVGNFAGGPVADLTLDASLASGSIYITEYTD